MLRYKDGIALTGCIVVFIGNYFPWLINRPGLLDLVKPMEATGIHLPRAVLLVPLPIIVGFVYFDIYSALRKILIGSFSICCLIAPPLRLSDVAELGGTVWIPAAGFYITLFGGSVLLISTAIRKERKIPVDLQAINNI